MTNELNVVAFDDGHSVNKIFKGGQKIKIPSFITSDREISQEFSSSREKHSLIVAEIAGERFVVGDKAAELDPNIQLNMGEQKHMDDSFIPLFKASLGVQAPTNHEVINILMMNLPINYYTEDRIEMLKRTAEGRHEVAISLDGKNFVHKCIEVEEVVVKRQGFGGFCDAIMDGNGEIADAKLASGFNVIVDIGSKTVNILALNRMNIVKELTTHTYDGMFSAYLEIGRKLENKLGGTIVDGQLPAIVQSREFKGKDIGILIDNEFARHAKFILNLLNNKFLRYWSSVSNVIFTGGGAEALEPYLKGKLPQGVNEKFLGQFSNAQGLWKFGVQLAKKKTKTPQPSGIYYRG